MSDMSRRSAWMVVTCDHPRRGRNHPAAVGELDSIEGVFTDILAAYDFAERIDRRLGHDRAEVEEVAYFPDPEGVDAATMAASIEAVAASWEQEHMT